MATTFILIRTICTWGNVQPECCYDLGEGINYIPLPDVQQPLLSLFLSLFFSHFLCLLHTHTDTRHSIWPNFQAFVHIEPLSWMSPSLTYLFSLCDIGFGMREIKFLNTIPFLSPRDPPNPGIEPRSLALQADSLPSEPPGKPHALTTTDWISHLHNMGFSSVKWE